MLVMSLLGTGISKMTNESTSGNKEDCHASCMTCSGATANDCEACDPNYAKLYKGACLIECPIGTFE